MEILKLKGVKMYLKLNKRQQKVVDCKSSDMIIVSGNGGGKTSVGMYMGINFCRNNPGTVGLYIIPASSNLSFEIKTWSDRMKIGIEICEHEICRMDNCINFKNKSKIRFVKPHVDEIQKLRTTVLDWAVVDGIDSYMNFYKETNFKSESNKKMEEMKEMCSILECRVRNREGFILFITSPSEYCEFLLERMKNRPKQFTLIDLTPWEGLPKEYAEKLKKEYGKWFTE